MPSRYSFIPAAAVADPNLTDGDIRVLAALGSFTDDKSSCYPSIAKVAQRCCRTPRSVQRSLDLLVRRGYVALSRRPGHSSLFTVLLDAHLRSSTERHRWRTWGDSRVTHIVPIERKDKEKQIATRVLPAAAPDGAAGESETWRVTEMVQSLEAGTSPRGRHKEGRQ